jgi:hypothetical protein
MMFGIVNSNCEAIVKVVVGSIGSPSISIEVIQNGRVTIEALKEK